ncbi:MAG: winged helix-turn-helix transcriptional regulator [Firmicutes bacterium]|nr:winged helix-turn-helix transcriptional regulator [Bacillota bacterium]
MDILFDNTKMAKMFKALGDENRLRILQMLGDEETCACVLLKELEISQPTLSHHMKLLVDAELVSARKDGRWMRYSVNKPGMQAGQLAMAHLMASKSGLVCDCLKKEGE